MTKYIPVIGMEIHAELKTQSKMFCSCLNESEFEKEPNVHICSVCTGQPGALPTPNKEAIFFVQKVGTALHCRINDWSKFDRKNYFYPDLPKGYQISQYDRPLVEMGYLDIDNDRIGITRIHMEEDTAKSQHIQETGETLIDFNRSGLPLMELVTEPDIVSGEQARKFCQKLQRILRYLEVSYADMEKGQMRCEANISLYQEGEDRLSGTKVEVKNLNSFRSVERAIAYEINRQTQALENGEKIVQETRGWDDVQQKTISQRIKESAHDYRYFPEPDIPPMEFSLEYKEGLKKALPELPEEKKRRFMEQMALTIEQAEILTNDKDIASYFENVMSELEEKILSKEFFGNYQKARESVVNYLIVEVRKFLVEDRLSFSDIKITAENFAEFAVILSEGKINSSAAQRVLREMYETGEDPSTIIDEKNLSQIEDEGELMKIIEDVIEKNNQSVQDYRAGKEKAMGFLVGCVMKETKGKAHPQKAQELLKKKIIK